MDSYNSYSFYPPVMTMPLPFVGEPVVPVTVTLPVTLKTPPLYVQPSPLYLVVEPTSMTLSVISIADAASAASGKAGSSSGSKSKMTIETEYLFSLL